MSEYLYYTDHIPDIPEDILPSVDEILNSPMYPHCEEFEELRHPECRVLHYRKRVNPELKQWLLNVFGEDITATFVVFNANLGLHKDIRDMSYNYIVDAGGENIETSIWSGDLTHIKSLNTWHSIRPDYEEHQQPVGVQKIDGIVLEPKKWHMLRTDVLHAVDGEHVRPRILLCVIPKDAIRNPKSTVLSKEIASWFTDW
jgi:hypothetical protein